MADRKYGPRHIVGLMCAAAMAIGVASCGGGSGGTSSGSTNASGPHRDNIKTALSTAISGCWDPNNRGGNIWGAYQQDYFYEGWMLNSAGTACTSGQEGFSATTVNANLQTFHSSTDAAKGAKEQTSVSHVLAVYQGGVYVLTVVQGSTPQLAQAAQHAAESNDMKKVAS